MPTSEIESSYHGNMRGEGPSIFVLYVDIIRTLSKAVTKRGFPSKLSVTKL